ncbi:MAG: glycosyltransferase family 4 protein, partial [Lachnospiraceae bacterium]
GLYDFRKELLQRLIKEGFRVVVSVPEGNYRERLIGLGCIYAMTNFNRRGMNPLKDASLFLRYCRLLRKYHPAVVLTYTIKPNIYGCIACRLKHIPYLVNITGLGMALEQPGRLQTMIVALYRTALKRAACVFFQNTYNRNFMIDKKCIFGRSRLISGSGVNLQEHGMIPYPSEQPEIRLLSVMRVMRAKGIEELLYAAPLIKREYPNVLFEIAGAYEEEERERYEPLIKDLQEKGVLRYYGYREDLQQIMAASHIIVHPSYSEGMSNVLLEAAATGRPVVASDIQGCREIMIEGQTGFACQVHDGDALLQAIRRMLSMSPSERGRMGQAGRAQVEQHFDRTAVVNIYLDEITDIVSQY